ncbi:MAG: collagen-like protein [Firmicutes bacterium]|nr:collagen-like protein [Bacillota bacterium]MCL1953951.1 collagen-like protein [Bacillota bacterium]
MGIVLSEQITQVKGSSGEKGVIGDTGPQGENATTAPKGPTGEQGKSGDAWVIFNTNNRDVMFMDKDNPTYQIIATFTNPNNLQISSYVVRNTLDVFRYSGTSGYSYERTIPANNSITISGNTVTITLQFNPGVVPDSPYGYNYVVGFWKDYFDDYTDEELDMYVTDFPAYIKFVG